MSSLWDRAKNAATRTKLQGEIMLHEREIKARQQRFGVVLFDLLSSEKGAFVIKTPGIFHANQEQVKGPFERCRNDVDALEMEKNEHQQQLEFYQASKERAAPAYSARDKAAKAGDWVSNTASEGKLQAQIALLDRKIKQRKQEFGVEVYDMLEYKPPESGGVKGAVSSTFSKFNQKEKEIEQCVEEVKKDVAFIQRRIQFKQEQIIQLGGSVKTEF